MISRLSLFLIAFLGSAGLVSSWGLVSFTGHVSEKHQQPRAASSRRSLVRQASQNDDETSQAGQSTSALPKLIMFDLDGCLWRPEMYELLYFSGGSGAPFSRSPDYENDRTILTCKGEPCRLLGQVREIMQEIHCHPTNKWQNTLVGISSRTDQPDWARELLEKFTIAKMDSQGRELAGESFAMKEVFQGPIEISTESKVSHFKRVAEKTGISFEDMLFFDNERGNCVEVAKLGVVVAWVPDGVTKLMWDISLQNFSTASGKVFGLDVFGYDTLEGANLFYGDGPKKTEW